MTKLNSRLGALTTVWIVALLPSTAMATVVNMDEFLVDRNGIAIFDDSFASNTTLVGGNGTLQPASVNFSDGTTANYFVHGSIPQTTANSGQATLNTANGIVISQPPPFISAVQETNAFLQTGTNPAGAHALTPTSSFTITGLFDFAVPTTTLGTYSISLTNRIAANMDLANLLQVRVRQCATGTGLCGALSGPVLQFFFGDFANNTEALIGQVALTAAELADQQIELEFQKAANSDAISALYSFGTGDTLLTFSGTPLASLGTTSASTDVFTTADQFVLPGFEAFDPVKVPEPPSLLLASGLICLASLATRRQHQQ